MQDKCLWMQVGEGCELAEKGEERKEEEEEEEEAEEAVTWEKVYMHR